MNLLVTGAWQCTVKQLNDLREHGHTVAFMQFEKDTLPCKYEWVEGVICNGLFLSHPIEKFVNLRYIQLTSAGYDRVDMDYVKAHNIEIHNAKGVYSIPMAEFAVCGVLQLYKQSRFFRENQKQHKWEKHRGLCELNGKPVVIVGCGDVGQECAKRFSAFGCRVIGVNRTVRVLPYFERVLPLDALPKVLGEADILVLSIAVTGETRHLMDKAAFERLKDGAVLVNIARGAIVDTGALQDWLRSDRSRGAVLDVFEEEPLPEDSPLWDEEKVILTPHNSFVADGNWERMNKLILNGLKAFI